MSQFELTFENDTTEIVTADDLRAVFDVPRAGVIKIECIDKRLVWRAVRAVNDRLNDYGREYHDAHTVAPYIEELLAANGFNVTLFPPRGNEGAYRNVPLNKGVYFTMTWYRMPSGKLEIVAYVS